MNDLVDSLFEDLPEDDVQETYWKSRCADLIQSHQPLRDLLDKAERVCNWIGDDSASCYKANLELEKALEPWKPK